MTLPPDDCLDCLKGIRNMESSFGEGFDYTVFSDSKPIAELGGWDGSSVNWDLPRGRALEQLLSQTKNGQIQFKAGAIRIPRLEIDKIIRRYGAENLSYELREENGNHYHGHILFSHSLKPKQKTTISSLLVNVYIEYHKLVQ